MNANSILDAVQKVSEVVAALKDGRIIVTDENRAWANRLLALPRGATGLLDISSLSEIDVAMARSAAILLRGIVQEEKKQKGAEPLGMQDAQCELFRLFEKLFIALIGVSSGLVKSHEEVRERMFARVSGRYKDFGKDVNSVAEEIQDFYTCNALEMFRAGKQLGGLKVVLGGQRAFGSSALAATRAAGLYCDTQLIPDPVYPFFTGDLHLNALHLQLALVLFHLLPLRPLVDARLNEPPILVFPSFEQILEREDAATQAGIASLVLKVVGPSCNASLQSLEEIAEFSRSHEGVFLEAVLRDRLFVPSGVDPQRILNPEEAVERYLGSLEGIRSEETLAMMRQWPAGVLVLNGIMERLAPQHHLLENANELIAQPMLSQRSHWHYFERCASASARELADARIISRECLGVLRAIQDDSLGWLAAIPVEGLADLRRNREHAELREQLKKYTAQLTAAGSTELESVVREVRHGLEAMVQSQRKVIKDIERKYAVNNWKIMAGVSLAAGAAASVAFLPALAAITGVAAPVATALLTVGAGAVALTKEYVGEAVDKHQARKSLLGVLATARAGNG